jgi:hypothetical protein
VEKEKKALQVFGYGLGSMAAIFGIGGFLKHGLHLAPIILVLCCVIVVSVTALNWQALRLGYKGWMKVTHSIGAVVTTVMLSVVFFAVITPAAIILKLLGKDYLARKPHRSANTYWRSRSAVELPPPGGDMARATIVKEFWIFLKARKLLWMAPIVFVLLFLGLLIIFAQSSAFAPFIYPLF